MIVNPDQVSQSGVEVGQAAEVMRTRFGAADSDIGSSMSGWVGRSAEAMAAKASQWSAATTAYHQDLAGHGEKFVAAAGLYRSADEEGAGAVDGAVPAVEA